MDLGGIDQRIAEVHRGRKWIVAFEAAAGQMGVAVFVDLCCLTAEHDDRCAGVFDDGGPVDVIDLGFGVLTVRQGTGRRLLDELVSRERHAEFVRSLDDDADLATT